MTNVFEEAYMPETVHSAIITLQCAVMVNSDVQIGGATAENLIRIAREVDDSDIAHELRELKDAINEELRQKSSQSPRVIESLKGLSKLF